MKRSSWPSSDCRPLAVDLGRRPFRHLRRAPWPPTRWPVRLGALSRLGRIRPSPFAWRDAAVACSGVTRWPAQAILLGCPCRKMRLICRRSTPWRRLGTKFVLGNRAKYGSVLLRWRADSRHRVRRSHHRRGEHGTGRFWRAPDDVTALRPSGLSSRTRRRRVCLRRGLRLRPSLRGTALPVMAVPAIIASTSPFADGAASLHDEFAWRIARE